MHGRRAKRWMAGVHSALRRLLSGQEASPTRSLTPRARGAEWWRHPQAPQFHLDPGLEHLADNRTVRLLMTVQQQAGVDVEASLEARWRGAGIEMEFTRPWLDVRERTYQVKPVVADPLAATDTSIDSEHISFEVRFEWAGGPRHCRWIWPLVQEHNGRWMLDAAGSNSATLAERW